MSKVIELTDEQYRITERAAATHGQTPDAFLAQLIEELRDRDRDPRYHETDDWLRHLGMSDELLASPRRRRATQAMATPRPHWR